MGDGFRGDPGFLHLKLSHAWGRKDEQATCTRGKPGHKLGDEKKHFYEEQAKPNTGYSNSRKRLLELPF